MYPTGTTKIALVDDHKLFRKGLLELINGFSGYTVSLEAENGKDFIRKLFPEKVPDIVLLDISMPVMDGFDTAVWLQEHHPGVKILALSMSNDDETVLRMLKCGVDGYVLKNVDPAELRMALDAMEINGSYYSSSVSDILKRDLKTTKQPETELTEREVEFLKLVCTELPYKSMAPFLHVSPRVVESTREALFKKLEVVSRTGLVLYAIKNGIHKIE